jgi:small GTP-binding protein
MPYLATLDNLDKQIRIWRYDPAVLLEVEPAQQTVRYTNAKVVLVGDSAVGKTSLANALLGRTYQGTTSTYGRHVTRYHTEKLTIDEEGQIFELREIWLWDIAGQLDLRIVHQLHLDEVTLALVMFDGSKSDPFSGVFYWHRALQHSRQVVNSRITIPLKKVLVAGRIDVGGVGTSQERIDRLRSELEFDAFIKTSAVQAAGITALDRVIHEIIDWDALPRVRSTALFQRIKNFLGRMREEGKLLHRIDQLYDTYVFQQEVDESSDDL